MSKIVEVRFSCKVKDLTEEQVEGILKAHDEELDIDVGLGYQGFAAATFDADDDAHARTLGELVGETAEGLGLTVTDVEVLSEEEYEKRAWNESGVDPNA